MRPILGAEDQRLLEHYSAVIGIDEVGRGALAGPVVVCGARFLSVAANPDICDSKLNSPRRRERAASWTRLYADGWIMLEVWPEVIDRINILEATRVAMKTIARRLRARESEVVVVDAVDLGPGISNTISVAKADSRYFSVAAASNVAKVHRDRLMVDLAETYPHWSWENNKGYPTAAHRAGIERHGSNCLHRRSFKLN